MQIKNQSCRYDIFLIWSAINIINYQIKGNLIKMENKVVSYIFFLFYLSKNTYEQDTIPIEYFSSECKSNISLYIIVT